MRILFVGMSQSVHLARWIHQLEGTGWDLHLVPWEWPSSLHPLITDVTFHGVGWFRPPGLPDSVRTPMPRWLPKHGSFRVHKTVARLCADRFSMPRQLADAINRVRPDIVHTLEMQHSGYMMQAALPRIRGRLPRWIYSSWGSDLYFFGKMPEHLPRIRQVLGICDGLMTDCLRDSTLAREYGFKGDFLGVFPGPGGYRIDAMRRLEGPVPSRRRLILIKGQQHWAGRALTALAAVQQCSDKLQDYEIVVYYTTDNVQAVVQHMQMTTDLRIRALASAQPHDDIVRLMGQARIALGLAVTDGVPNAMLEAMVMGAFPIQSDTGATGEWIDDGRNGLMVRPEDVAGVEAALRRAISDDDLVDSAAVINRRLTDERIDLSVVRPRVIEAYERALRSV